MARRSGRRTRKRIVTYNVNSLVAAIGRKEGHLLDFIERNRGDVIALQEVMVDPNQKLKGDKWRLAPFARRLRKLGYWLYWHPGTRNGGGYGGTMFLSLVEPERVVRGTGNQEVDTEGRFIALIFSDAVVVNTYVPTLSLDLTGMDRKDKFWTAAEDRYRNIVKHFPDRPTLWVGDMNVAPLEKDADEEGIRRSFDRTKMKHVLQDELPSCSTRERQNLAGVLERLGLVDAFEGQRETARGRDSTGSDRYTQFNHGNREHGAGQRIDHVFTNMPLTASVKGEAVVVRVTVLKDERGSDHVPVEVVAEFATVDTEPATGVSMARALGQERREHQVETQDRREWKAGMRVLVAKKEVNCSTGDTPELVNNELTRRGVREHIGRG